MSIIQQLEEKMKVTGMSIPAIAAATGIPTERMRKWLKGIGNPKTEDTKKLEAFLRGNKRLDKVPLETIVSESELPYGQKNPQPVARDQEVIDLLREKVASLEAQVDLRDLVTSLSSVLKAFEGIESKLDGLVATALLKGEEPQKVGKSKKGRKSGKNEIGKPF